MDSSEPTATDWRQQMDGLADQAASGPRKLRAHDHAALVYWSSEEYFEAIVPFLLEGLQAGELVVHVHHDEPAEPLLAALEQAGEDVAARRASGQLVVLPASEAFFPKGYLDVDEAMASVQDVIAASKSSGAKMVRFSVDISYVLSGVPGMENAMVFDARANDEIFARHDFMCVCAFNASHGSNEVVEDMLATHPLVFVRGLPLSNPHYRTWKQLSAAATHLQRWKSRYSAIVHSESA